MFFMMYQNTSTAQMLDAFAAADQGDYSGLALMCFMFDHMIAGAVNWGRDDDYDSYRSNDPDHPATVGTPAAVREGLRAFYTFDDPDLPLFNDAETGSLLGSAGAAPTRFASTASGVQAYAASTQVAPPQTLSLVACGNCGSAHSG